MILPAIWRAFNRAQERGAAGGIILILRQSVVPGARIASYQDVVMDESIRIARVRRVWNAAMLDPHSKLFRMLSYSALRSGLRRRYPILVADHPVLHAAATGRHT